MHRRTTHHLYYENERLKNNLLEADKLARALINLALTCENDPRYDALNEAWNVVNEYRKKYGQNRV